MCDVPCARNLDIIRVFDMSDNAELSGTRTALADAVQAASKHKRPCGALANIMQTGCLRGRNPVYSLTGIDARTTVTTVRQISQ